MEPSPSYLYVSSKIRFPMQKCTFFSENLIFVVFVAFWALRLLFFQNLVNQEMLLPIFIFLIRRLVKKLFHFEVMFRQGGGVKRHITVIGHFLQKIQVILTLFSQSKFSLATKLGHPNLIFSVKTFTSDKTLSSKPCFPSQNLRRKKL